MSTHKKNPERDAWVGMKRRCSNPKSPDYKNYGGRGITVCERWSSFDNFIADMGARPGPGYSIDRINNDGNYEPGNCRWATWRQQAWNRRNVLNAIGASIEKGSKKWRVNIRIDGKMKYLGLFETKEEAVRIYQQTRAARAAA